MASTTSIRHAPIALAVFTLCAQAQTEAPTESALPTVVIKARSAPSPTELSGFGNVPLARSPLQATVIDEEQMQTYGITRLADIVKFDASVTTPTTPRATSTTSRCAASRWTTASTSAATACRSTPRPRSRSTTRRASTSCKGLSGMQAGTSAPGGLVDYVVKRPLDAPLRSALRSNGASAAACSALSTSASASATTTRSAFASTPPPSTSTRSSQGATGNRNLLALAGDWRTDAQRRCSRPRSRHSHRSQPSVPGFSLLGDSVPRAADPRINLNNQPWSLPVVFDATTGSLRLTQQARRRLALSSRTGCATPAHRRPHRLPVRLHRPNRADGTTSTASAPTAPSTSTTSAARTSTPQQQRSTSRCTATCRPARSPHADQPACSAANDREPLPGRCVQLRPAPATWTARW